MTDALRLYRDLAWLWPLWADPDEYAPWCDAAAQLIRQYSLIEARSLLNMACGGGKTAFNLKRHFEVTGIDISQPMLDLAKKLNPECTFVRADMRTCNLGRQFDCVLVDDAVEGMPHADLAATFRTAFAHLRSGGVMVVSPGDVTKENFEQNRTSVSQATSRLKPANTNVVFIENLYDPDPTDDTYEFTIIYLIREDGKLRVEVDGETCAFVPPEAWRTMIGDSGFEVHEESSTENDPTFSGLVGVKPR